MFLQAKICLQPTQIVLNVRTLVSCLAKFSSFPSALLTMFHVLAWQYLFVLTISLFCWILIVNLPSLCLLPDVLTPSSDDCQRVRLSLIKRICACILPQRPICFDTSRKPTKTYKFEDFNIINCLILIIIIRIIIK